MSERSPKATPRRRWLAWRPDESITADSAWSEPSKPSIPGFDGFDGSSQAQAAEIETAPRNRDTLTPEHKSLKSLVDLPGTDERVMSWAEWQARNLNRLFLEEGQTGQPGRITADTVRHGQRIQARDADDE